MKIGSSITLAICVLVIVPYICQGLLCYECLRVKSDEECRRKSVVTECKNNEESCQVEVRRHAFFGFQRMTKRCKQARACNNNYLQNNASGFTSMQCENKALFVSVCRCCCVDDLCNFGSEIESCSGVVNPNLLRDMQPNPTCPELGEVRHGVFTCSEANEPGSSCKLHCSSGYDIYGRAIITCQKAARDLAVWSFLVPCCSRPCPPHGQMDLVIALDASMRDPEIWELLKEFTLEILRFGSKCAKICQVISGYRPRNPAYSSPFAIGPHETQVGVIMYKEKVNLKRGFVMKKHDEKDKLLDAIMNTRNDFKTKGGIRPGLALRSASLRSFSRGSGNRESYRDVMLLFRMGKALEEDPSPQVPAKIMEDNGITVITVGIGDNTNKDEVLLTASSPDKAIFVKEGIQAYRFYVDQIREALCGDPCDR